ncbi:MAG: hypothetical protein SF029_21580 [bacterium]|nr:hypothetical protein [bacterium]
MTRHIRYTALSLLLLLFIAVSPAHAHSPTQTVPPELVAVNWLILLGMALAFGGTAFDLAVLRQDESRSALQDRVSQAVLAGWMMLGVGSIAALVVQASLIGFSPFTVLFDPLLQAAFGIAYGVVWMLSLIAWGAAGFLLLRGNGRAALMMLAVFYFVVIMYGHSPQPDALLLVLAEWLHRLALALLLGLLVMLPLVVIPARHRHPTLFSAVVGYARPVLIAAVLTWLLVGWTDLPDRRLLTTPDGQWVVARGLLFAPALLVAAFGLNRRNRLLAFSPSIGAEIGLFLGGLVAALVLNAAQPAPPPTEPTLTSTFYDGRQTASYVVDLVIDPGAVGENLFYTTLIDRSTGMRLSDAQVRLIVAPEAADTAQADVVLESMGDGNYEATSPVFNVPGTWQVTMAVERGGSEESVVFTPQIAAEPSGAAAVTQANPLPLALPLLIGVLLTGAMGAFVGRRIGI